MSDINLFDRRSWGTVREAKGITYKALAEACNVNPSMPEKWFNGNKGHRHPRLHHQILLAKALGIPLRSLLSAINDPDIKAAIRAAYND